MTNAQRRFHQQLNRQYFDGRLPEYRIINDDALRSRCGRCRKQQREIHVSPLESGDGLTEILLHEMAHAAVRKAGHGKAWLAEMQRLANLGAPTREDLQAYQDRERVITAKDMESEAFDMGCASEIPWAKTRPIIGLQYGLTNAHGRAHSKRAAQLMQRLRRHFSRGQRLCQVQPERLIHKGAKIKLPGP